MMMLVVVVCGLPTCRHCLYRQLVNQPWVTVHSQWLLPGHGTVCRRLSSVRRHCQAFVDKSRRFCSSRASADSATATTRGAVPCGAVPDAVRKNLQGRSFAGGRSVLQDETGLNYGNEKQKRCRTEPTTDEPHAR